MKGIKIIKTFSNIALKQESPTGAQKGNSLLHQIGYALLPIPKNYTVWFCHLEVHSFQPLPQEMFSRQSPSMCLKVVPIFISFSDWLNCVLLY